MTDLQLQLLVSAIAVVAWSVAALIDGLRAPVRAGVLLVVALGMLAVSNLAVIGPLEIVPGVTIGVTTMATVNRAFVAAVGLVYAIRAGGRLWEAGPGSRHGPGRRES